MENAWLQSGSSPPIDPSFGNLPPSTLRFSAFQHEYFVDPTVAAEFLSITRKYLLKLSRDGVVPAHPLGIGSRKQWRYRISELAEWGLSQCPCSTDNKGGSPRATRKGN